MGRDFGLGLNAGKEGEIGERRRTWEDVGGVRGDVWEGVGGR